MNLFLALEWMMLKRKTRHSLEKMGSVPDCRYRGLLQAQMPTSEVDGLVKALLGRIMPVLRDEGNASLSFNVGVVVFFPHHRRVAMLLCTTSRTFHPYMFISYRINVLSLVLLIPDWCSEGLSLRPRITINLFRTSTKQIPDYLR